MHAAAIVRGVVALLAIFGVQLSSDVVALVEQNVIAIVTAVLALWGAWPAILAAWRKARGTE